jgi:endonuclease/exonuclease/phosphatase family metal-dependent hydrolase
MSLLEFFWENNHPMIVCGDFNTHSQSWGCESDDVGANILQAMLDDHDLVHVNDGSLIRIAAPPNKSSAIDLTLKMFR